jgi:hypothetical protein
MYLRYTTRREDGKVYRYWRLVRSVRGGRRGIQLTVAHGIYRATSDGSSA